MSLPAPLGLSNDGLTIVMHLPGIALENPILEIGGMRLTRMRLADYVVLEDSELAMEMAGPWEANEHAFWAVVLDDFVGSAAEAEDVRNICLENVRVLLRALRLHKAGPVVDPAQSTLFLRLGPTNIRRPGLYRHRLMEGTLTPRYELGVVDDQPVSDLVAKLRAPRVAEDPTIGLALRHLDWASRYGLRAEHRAALLFVALEATYGEYSRTSRPSPRCRLGQAAAMVSRAADATAVGTSLDGPVRQFRNRTAHGAVDGLFSTDELTMLEDGVRDGLRALVDFACRFDDSHDRLEDVADGLSGLPTKLAFQTLLGHAANGSPDALAMLRP